MIIEKIKQFRHVQKLQALYKKYERFSLPLFLIIGVILDAITFRSIDLNTSFIILAVYTILAAGAMAFMSYYDTSGLEHKTIYLGYVRLYSPFVIQLTFGALLSASLIFYWFSGAFSVSWPFVLLLAFLMASNDIFRKYYLKIQVQLGVFFFILFSLSVLFFSFAINSVSVWTFICGGLVAITIIFLYFKLLTILSPSLKKINRQFITTILVIFGLMNLFYFLDIIPPIPLALRDAGVYHLVERANGSYKTLAEKESFWDKIIPGQKIHIKDGERVYVFTAIFAPADLQTKIYHNWQYYDEPNNKWVERSISEFDIKGGRDDGFRGYSYRTNLKPGKWRVFVENLEGQVMGRINFTVEKIDTDVELVEGVK